MFVFLSIVQGGNDGKGLKVGEKNEKARHFKCIKRENFFSFTDLVFVINELISENFSKKIPAFVALTRCEFQLKTGPF